jgi:phenylalanyl-tRNA synthetase beta chain
MTDRDLDFYDAKGAVEAALDAIGFGTPEFNAADDSRHLRTGQSAQITVAGTAVGTLGRLNEELTSDYKFKQPVYVAELDLQAILAQEIPPVLYTSLPKYPAVVRDVSFVVTREISFDQIKSAIVGERRELCRSVGFVDVYEGKGMGQNERSLTIRLEYRSDERTLLDSEVDEVHTQLIETVERELNIRRRF